MSVKHLAAVRRVDKAAAGLSMAVSFALHVLADHSDQSGNAFPSQELLGLETGMTARHIRRCLLELRKMGIVEVVRGRQHAPNHYRLVLEKLGALPLAHLGTDAPPSVPSNDIQTGHPGPLSVDARPDTQVRSDALPVDPPDRTSETSRPDICDIQTGHPGPPKLKVSKSKQNLERERARLTLALALPAKTKPKADKGTRLPEDWKLTPELIAYAHRLGVDPEPSAEAFADYWHASDSKNALKRDWNAAFRMWLRRDIERGSAKRLPPRPKLAQTAPAEPPATAAQLAEVRSLFAKVKDVNAFLERGSKT